MDAKPIALFFACSDNQIRQAALTVQQLEKLKGFVIHKLQGGVLKLHDKPVQKNENKAPQK
jgi:hypothetical protein